MGSIHFFRSAVDEHVFCRGPFQSGVAPTEEAPEPGHSQSQRFLAAVRRRVAVALVEDVLGVRTDHHPDVVQDAIDALVPEVVPQRFCQVASAVLTSVSSFFDSQQLPRKGTAANEEARAGSQCSTTGHRGCSVHQRGLSEQHAVAALTVNPFKRLGPHTSRLGHVPEGGVSHHEDPGVDEVEGPESGARSRPSPGRA